MKIAPRLLIVPVALVALVVAPVTAGGFLGRDDPPGTPKNPLTAAPMDPEIVAAAKQRGHFNEARPPQLAPGETDQTSRPCTLVTADEASEIFGAKVQKPVEAPLGPSCIFRSNAREDFVSVSLQRMEREHVKARIGDRERFGVGRETGYCGPGESGNLLVPLPGDRVLTVEGGTAGCEVASAFAAKALGRISRR